MKGMYQWLGRHVHAPYGTAIFGLLVFIEGFFFVPVSSLLTFFCLENRKRSFFYATVATLMSIFAAAVGYGIGYLATDNVTIRNGIFYIISEKKFNVGIEYYSHYQAALAFLVALTPLPYKVLTLSAGFCKLPLASFILFTCLARGLRFFALATGVYIWGEMVQYYIDRYFYYLLAGIGIMFIAMLWILH